MLGLQVLEPALNQAHRRQAVRQGPLHPLRRSGCYGSLLQVSGGALEVRAGGVSWGRAGPVPADGVPHVHRRGPQWQLEQRGWSQRRWGPHPACRIRRGQGRWSGGRVGAAGALSSAGQPAYLGCSSWQQCSPRSPSRSPALGTAPSSLQKVPQVRARRQHHPPGQEAAPLSSPRPTTPSPLQVPPGPRRCSGSSPPGSWSRHRRARYRARAGRGEGLPGSLLGQATAWLGSLDRPGPYFCPSVSLCV